MAATDPSNHHAPNVAPPDPHTAVPDDVGTNVRGGLVLVPALFSPGTATTALGEATHGRSLPRRSDIEEMATPHGDKYDTVPSYKEICLPPSRDPDRFQDDTFNQWDALLKCEGCRAYAAIQKQHRHDDV